MAKELQSVDRYASKEQISAIVTRAPKLFSVLSLVQNLKSIPELIENNIFDDVFETLSCQGKVKYSQGDINFPLVKTPQLQRILYGEHWKIPPVLSAGTTPRYPASFILPWTALGSLGDGSYGQVSKVRMAPGHLAERFLVRFRDFHGDRD